jgi:hypothetical protein
VSEPGDLVTAALPGQHLPANNAVRRVGTVISIALGTPNKVEIALGGDTTQTGLFCYLKSYFPVVGDVVMVLSVGPDHLVLGSISDGILPDQDAPTFTGTALTGTYDSALPIRHSYFVKSGTSDASGLFTVSMPSGVTAILCATWMKAAVAGFDIIYRNESTVTTLTFQTRNNDATNAAAALKAYGVYIDITWQ